MSAETDKQINDYKATGHKTPHRLLHDALSKEHYARVLVNMREENNGLPCEPTFYDSETESQALMDAFTWSRENHEYWESIYHRLGGDEL